MRRPAGALIAIALAVFPGGAGCAKVAAWRLPPTLATPEVRTLTGLDPAADPALLPAAFGAGSVGRLTARSPKHALAQARFQDARGAEGLHRDAAARLYLEAMSLASPRIVELVANGDAALPGSERAEVQALYNHALERFLRLTSGFSLHLDEAWRGELQQRGFNVSIRRGDGVWGPERFDELKFAADYLVLGIANHYGNNGLGVPLIAIRRRTRTERARPLGEPRFYPNWEVYPVTALLRVAPGPDGAPAAELELYDALRLTHARIDGQAVPLETDLTTPIAYHFADGNLDRYEQLGLFNPQKVTHQSGLYMLHPYERGKIPVVMIHGLWSSPMCWVKVVNDLRGDPALRERYQFWMYLYPTGNPFNLSAASLRRELVEARRAVDPEATDLAYDQMVLIGHSMGGLLAKMMITHSGDEVWKLFSPRPFAELQATSSERALLERICFFEPVPHVRRVIFIATPHRGSRLGSHLIGRLGDRLIRLPTPLHEAYESVVARNGPDFFTPEARDRLPTSIAELAKDSPMLLTLDRLPISDRVACHSLIGKSSPGPLESSTDGIVPYESSHFAQASSELVVAANHYCQDNPLSIQELRRILTRHAEQADRETELEANRLADEHEAEPPTRLGAKRKAVRSASVRPR